MSHDSTPAVAKLDEIDLEALGDISAVLWYDRSHGMPSALPNLADHPMLVLPPEFATSALLLPAPTATDLQPQPQPQPPQSPQQPQEIMVPLKRRSGRPPLNLTPEERAQRREVQRVRHASTSPAFSWHRPP